MKAVLRRSALIALISTALGVFSWHAYAESNRVTFPKDIEQLIHYTTVKRGEVTERMLTTPEAIDAIKKGLQIPTGTHFVLADYRDGKVYRYFVMEKGEGWGADYPDDRRTGNWQFQWFNPDKTVNVAENTAQCQSCHQGRADNEFLYTFDRIPEFDGTAVD